MGLFKKRQQTQVELEAMRAEMRGLRELLVHTATVKDRLAERLGHLDAENERLHQQVGDVEARVGEVDTKVASVEHEVITVAGSIGSTIEHAIKTAAHGSPSNDDVEGLRHEVRSLVALRAPVGDDDQDGPLADLKNQLEDLAAALQRQQTQIADVALVATDAAERSGQTDAKVTEMAAADDWAPIGGTPPPDDGEAKRQLGQLAEKVGALDSRINQISLELTNQLTELSSDLDHASSRADAAELIDRINEQLDDITGGQERLATEQARYAIQFRADLADLADRLRRN